MLNAAGAVTWQRVAGIFGDTVSQPAGDTAANPLRFPGQWADDNTGLRYNYFRDYDPGTGRYIEMDPLGLDGGLNPYSYVDGNPVVYIDPLGLCWYYGAAGPGKNNPAMQNVNNVGPIPQGTYTVGPEHPGRRHGGGSGTGPATMDLTPAPGNNMLGRKDFRIHGDNVKHSGTASEGCIIFPRNVRDTINKSKDKCLKVTQ